MGSGDVVMRKVFDLVEHPAFAGSPMLADDHPDMRAMMAAISDAGGRPEPILVTAQNEIADGRHRKRCVELLNLDEIPTRLIADEDVEQTIVTSLLARRHLAKWQVAYTLAPLLSKLSDDGKKARLKGLRKGTLIVPVNRNLRATGKDQRLSEFLDTCGISHDTWQRVQALRKRFAEREDLRQRFEPALFSGDPETAMSLEGAMKATGSVMKYETGMPTPGEDRNEHDRLASKWLKKLTFHMGKEFWDAWGQRERSEIIERVTVQATLWPREVKAALCEALDKDLRSHPEEK